MPNPVLAELVLSDDERSQLQAWARRPTSAQALALRSRIVLAAAHRTVRELNTDIRNWIKTSNDNPRPYVWTKTADQILKSIARYCTRINDSRH